MKDSYEVYIHKFPNSKVYIGISNNSKRRWGKNGYGYRRHPYLYNAILKYGWNNIEHSILFTNLSHKEAAKKEQELIALYKSNEHDNGYNLTNGGEGSCGRKYSNETLNKMHKPQRCKIVYQYDAQYNLLKTYEGKYEAAKSVGCLPSSIKNACDKVGGMSFGFIFTTNLLTEEDIIQRKNIINNKREKRSQKSREIASNVTDEIKLKRNLTRNKNRISKGLSPIYPKYKTVNIVYQYDLKHNIEAEYDGYSSAARGTGLNCKKIKEACYSGEIYGGYYWGNKQKKVLAKNSPKYFITE